MLLKTLAVLGLLMAVSAAPAWAWGAKRGGAEGGIGGGTFRAIGTPSTYRGAVTAPEPLAILAVGLGLLGARLLRRP